MSRLKVLSLCLVATALSVGPGCSSRRAVLFGTHTNYGVDVTANAEGNPRMNVGYERGEVAVVPRGGNEQGYSVAGQFDAETNGVRSLAVREIFATGEAAMVSVTDSDSERKAAADKVISSMTEKTKSSNQIQQDSADTATKPETKSDTKKPELPMVIVTGTTVGLKAEVGVSSAMPPSGTFGYKRTTLTYIPVAEDDDEVRSVYADISIHRSSESFDTGVKVAKASAAGGLRLRQRIATGGAAVILASHDNKVKTAVTTTIEAEMAASDVRVQIKNLYKDLNPESKKKTAKDYLDGKYNTASHPGFGWSNDGSTIKLINIDSEKELDSIKSYLEKL